MRYHLVHLFAQLPALYTFRRSLTSLSHHVMSESLTSDGALQFGRFRISSTQIFYRSRSGLSFAFVNLRPIVPGHVLVCPVRIVPTLEHLDTDEYTDLWLSVRNVQRMLQQHYFSQATDFGFNVAIQDGIVAGQSVPHVHVHILPRQISEFVRNDAVYDELADWAPSQEMTREKHFIGTGSGSLHVPADDLRRDRTMQEMEAEASAYKLEFLNHGNLL